MPLEAQDKVPAELVPLRPPSSVCRGAIFPYPPWVPVCVGALTASPKDTSHSSP